LAIHPTRQPGDGRDKSHRGDKLRRIEPVRVRSQQPSNFAGIAINHTDSTGHFIDTLWDAYDLASDVQNCLGDSDSLACYMVPFDAFFLAMPIVSGIGDNVLRHADDVQHVNSVKSVRGAVAELSYGRGENLLRIAEAHPNKLGDSFRKTQCDVQHLPAGEVKMTNWETLSGRLRQRWNVSDEELFEQLIVTIRYAIFTPLDFVHSASDLLKGNAKSHQVQDWAEKCHKRCQDWLNGYLEIQDRCLDDSSDKKAACRCILQGVGPLLANSIDLVQEAQSLGLNESDLAEEDMTRIIKQLLQKLAIIVQIHSEVRTQDLSWLLKYIDGEDKLGQI
jgi:hypothetical protein